MIERLVATLEQKFQDLSAEEMADILWLMLQQWQSEMSSLSRVEPAGNSPLTVPNDEILAPDEPFPVPSPAKVTSPEPSPSPENAAAGLTTQPDKSTEASSSAGGTSPLAVPDSTALRRSLDILKAIRPLIRSVPSAERMYLDVPATVQAIAETDVWSLQLRPVPEPWLELALVIDTTPSMVIWQRTILKLRRVLAQSGVFRDVRLWSLETTDRSPTLGKTSEPNSPQRLCLRAGYGVRTVRQAPCRPQELLEPNGRRLILVVSDCIDPRWDEQPVREMLQVWANAGPMGLLQVLPEWLWGRTALSEVTKGQMVAQCPGQPSQSLRFVRRDHWRRKPIIGVKVPVMTLEPEVASRWSQMVSGQSSVSASGLVFSPVTVQQFPPEPAPDMQRPLESSSKPSAKERMTRFRDFSSPMARRLAGLLAACPEVNLPVVRMVQAALLPESQQVHVAEVLLGGLFKPQIDITAHTPADQVQYIFHDGVRPLVQNTISPDYAFSALSEWLKTRFGYSLEDFQAYITAEGADAIEPFAGVMLGVLKRRGGDYTSLIKRIERLSQSQFEPLTARTQPEVVIQNDAHSSSEDECVVNFPEFEMFEFVDAQLVEEVEDESVFPPPLQTEEFTVITFEPETLTNKAFDNRSASDDSIRQLIKETCQYPTGSPHRQRGLTKIIRALGPKLWRTDDAYYDAALQQTWIYFCRNLCEATTGRAYDPDVASPVTWLNAYLKRRLKDFAIAEKRTQPDIIPPWLEQVRAWAEADPDGTLAATHVSKHPTVTAQQLILRRLPPETPWKELSAEYGISVGTLSSFYQRQCLKRLQAFGKSEGYL
ncbi:MAG: SAV_2336 N-terminal domain-related protein [Cyanobacteria bacterium P01_F01_bin.53]